MNQGLQEGLQVLKQQKALAESLAEGRGQEVQGLRQEVKDLTGRLTEAESRVQQGELIRRKLHNTILVRPPSIMPGTWMHGCQCSDHGGKGMARLMNAQHGCKWFPVHDLAVDMRMVSVKSQTPSTPMNANISFAVATCTTCCELSCTPGQVMTFSRQHMHCVQELKGNIRVFCRVRPLLDSDALTQTTAVDQLIQFPSSGVLSSCDAASAGCAADCFSHPLKLLQDCHCAVVQVVSATITLATPIVRLLLDKLSRSRYPALKIGLWPILLRV